MPVFVPTQTLRFAVDISSIFRHGSGCTPINPCISCQGVAFLRRELGEAKFSEFVNIFSCATEETRPPAAPDFSLATSVHALGLKRRTLNCLVGHGVRTVSDILPLSAAQLLRIPGMGQVSLEDLEMQLQSRGLRIVEFSIPQTSLDTEISQLDFDQMAHGSSVTQYLNKSGVMTLGDLQRKTRGELLLIPGIGPAAIKKIEQRLRERNLSLRKFTHQRP